MGDRLMTVKEVAEYLRVSETVIYRMIREKSLPFVKVGGKYLFRTSSINNHLMNSEVGTS